MKFPPGTTGKVLKLIYAAAIIATITFRFTSSGVYVIVALAVAAVAGLVHLLINLTTQQSEDGPILSADGLLGAADLLSVNQGSLAGFEYNLLTNTSGRVMFVVQLGHNSWSHIIAYGDKSRLSDMTKSLIHSKWLEPSSLEGDFPDYFHMFCNPEAQVTLREIFAPDVMAEFADFCRSYDFEVFHDSLYVSKAGDAYDSTDETSLATDLDNFLTKNANTFARL